MNWGTTVQPSSCCSSCMSTALMFHAAHYWLMKLPSESQSVFQHRHLALISGSAVIWVLRQLCGYLVRTKCENLTFWLEKPQHGFSLEGRQETVG